MPNPLKGEVPLKLSDGREFVLVLDMEALIEAEATYGKPLNRLMADASVGFLGATRSLLYGALRAKQPTITAREAAMLLMEHGETVSEALTHATEAALPAPDPSAEGNVGKPRRGKSSGRSGARSS